MKFEGRYLFGTNQAGKGSKLQFNKYWNAKKISEGLGKLFKKKKLNQQKCDDCGADKLSIYHVVVVNGKKKTLCKWCKNKKRNKQ